MISLNPRETTNTSQHATTRELGLERLDSVSGGGGGILGTPPILTKEPKSSNPASTTSSGPNSPDDHVSTGQHKSASFDPVTVKF
jgi:hypothetical protein